MVLSDDNGTMKNNLSIIMNEKNGMMTNNNTAMVVHQNNGVANNHGGIVMVENNKETRSVAPIIPLSNPSNKHVEPVHNFSRENPAVVRWSREEESILMEKLAE
uniref:Uncharacterized protein n=1 Tax=Ananas comosus var. bracteatus TaxID=296719 RepID=A0A6V7NL24_ANACO|nr:unnamed protein product [Ananas comosus var. bracteatus]